MRYCSRCVPLLAGVGFPLAVALAVPAAAQATGQSPAQAPATTDPQASASTSPAQTTGDTLASPPSAAGQTPRESAPTALSDAGADPQQLGDIIVTAQKRSENIQRVPIAISVIGANDLATRGITSIAQTAAYVPNVEIKNTVSFAGSSQILAASIRGIGQNDFAFNLDPGVGVYVDGVYLARSIGANVDLLDLERVEVLKGPQGDLFGRNTIGGALNVVTREPDKDFRYQLQLIAGSYGRHDARGSVDLPIVGDKLLSQISFAFNRRNGYQRIIPFPGGGAINSDYGAYIAAGPVGGHSRQGGQNNESFRGKLLWHANDDLRFLLSADYSHADQEARAASLLAVRAGPTDGTILSVYNGCLFGAAPPILCGRRGTVGTSFFGVNADANPNNDRLPVSSAFMTADKDETYARGLNFDRLTAYGVSLTADWSIDGNWGIKSITAFRRLKSDFGFDEVGPIAVVQSSFSTRQRQYSQEFQLTSAMFNDRLKNIVGVFLFRETGSLLDLPQFGEGLIQIYGPNYFRNDSVAGFAHEHFDITDQWGLTFGVRYTSEWKRFEGRQQDLNGFFLRLRGVDPFGPIPPAVAALLPDPANPTRLYPLGRNRQHFENTSFRLGTEYKLTPDILAYYSFSQGFKSGGWTTRLLDLVPGNDIRQLEFKPETADTHEIGFKSTLFDRRVRLNLAAFTTAYHDIQITETRGIGPIFKNAGEATIRGFEAELQARAGQLTLGGSLGYLDAFYKSLAPNVAFPVTNDLVNTPKWSASASANYDVPIDRFVLSLNTDVTYKSSTSPDAENSPYGRTGNVGLLNASVSLAPQDRRWSLQAGVRNITDRRYIVGIYDQLRPGQLGFVTGSYSPPREWFLTLSVRN